MSYISLIGSSIDKKILDFATDNDIDLIVAGTKGASGLKAVVLGSNTASLINISEIPVVAVPPDARYTGFRRIVLATDMLNLDKQVRQVVNFAKAFNSQIDILHVADPQIKHRRRDELEGALARMTGYQKISLNVLPSDDVVAAINSFVLEDNADLLVMFTHELGTFEKLLRKGHTREVAHHIEVPLLALKRPL
jgi:nucleotide-binding universal stress UspA family protein